MSVKVKNLDDRALIEQFKKTGDPAWFAPLFERHQRRLYAICYALLDNQALAEDIVQEAFMRALQEIHRFKESDSGSQFSRWLCTIGRNLCLNELRKIKVRRDYQKIAQARPLHASPRTHIMLQLHELEKRLDLMEEKYRRCWVMFHVDAYTYRQIARVTGYSLSQVKTCIRTARRKLRSR